MIGKAWWGVRCAAWWILLAPVAVGVRAGMWREPGTPPRHTRDLFGRPGATETEGLGLDTVPEGVLCRDFDWPTDAEIEDAEWESLWLSLDRLLAKEAHDGNLRLAAAGIPLDVIVEHSLAEIQRHERALQVAGELTGQQPVLAGAT